MADGKGRVVWQWRMGSHNAGGVAIIVSCSKGEERRQLRTAFEVRFDKKSLTRRWLTSSAVLVRVLAFG
jgi:hypothetical protein